MKEIFDFCLRHWELSLVFILVVGAYLVYEYMFSESSDAISPEQAVALINHENGVVVDVRTPTEFGTGHILDAINIDSTEPDLKFKKLNKYTSKPVIVVCASGKRSSACLARIREQGLSRVYTLAGGITAWKDVGLPLINDNQ